MSVEYIREGMFPTDEVTRYPSALIIPHFGISTGYVGEHDYVVVPNGAKIEVEEVPQRRGGVRYFIEIVNNPGVVFQPGGMIEDNCLIAGEISTPHTDEVSLSIWKLFTKYFWGDFIKIGAFRVGPGALRLLHKGCRLTPDATWSREVDLNPALIEKTEREYRERQADEREF